MPQNYTDFPSQQQCKQYSGITYFQYVPHKWIKTIPEGDKVKEEDIELIAGKSWLTGYGFFQTIGFNEPVDVAMNGPMYRQVLRGAIPFQSEDLHHFFRFNNSKRFVLKIRDHSKHLRLVGHLNGGAALKGSFKISPKVSENIGYKYEYECRSHKPALYLLPTAGAPPSPTGMTVKTSEVINDHGSIPGVNANNVFDWLKDSANHDFSPAVPGDWSPAPSKVAAALNQLAANISGAGVTSFKGRSGPVVPLASDYDASQIDETATEKIMTDVERDKLSNIAVSQAVDLDQLEQLVNNLDAAIVLKGAWDASSGSFPGGGTAQAGHSWIVDTAGSVDGVAFSVDDRIIALLDNASTSTFAANWHKADYSDLINPTTVGDALAAAGAKTSPVDADTMPLNDSAASGALKKVIFANLKATLKGYFDTIYPALAHTHTSDEVTGTVLEITAATLTLDATHDNKILRFTNVAGCVVTLFAASAGFTCTGVNKSVLGQVTVETNATQKLDSVSGGIDGDFVTDDNNQGFSLACLATNDFWAQ